MKPTVTRVLEVAAGVIALRLAPSLPAYERSNGEILSGMLISISEEFRRAAARRVEENDALRRLFREAAPSIEDAELRSRLEASGNSSDSSLDVEDLDRSNGEMRALLIELHATIEEMESPAARELEQSIWNELVASTNRRRLSMATF